MQRRKPINRTGFARPPRPERLPAVLSPAVRQGVYAPASGVVLAQPKRGVVRSKALREAYRLIPCQWPTTPGAPSWSGVCGAQDGTVCCAHSNWADHGKSGARKADDNRAASLCYRHHTMLDQGGMQDERRRACWQFAHERSVRMLVAQGLWPADVAVPSEFSTKE